MSSVSAAILIIALVAVAGRLIGSVRFKGVRIGSAGVLFAGILFGHFGANINPEVGEFAKELGLVLFVFAVGLQLGPGIVRLWKQQGLALNGLALLIVSSGAALVYLFAQIADLSVYAAAGLFSGSTTNTPSLGAAQQAAATVVSPESGDPGALASAYAVTYPGGIIGIIGTMLTLRWLLKLDLSREVEEVNKRQQTKVEPIDRRSIQVDNPHLKGVRFGDIPGVEETGVRISRIRRSAEAAVHAANEKTSLQPGDIIQIVGTQRQLNRFEPLIGTRSNADLMQSPGDVTFRRVVVTEPAVLNKPLRDLSLDLIYNATVTRISRSGIEMTATGHSRFHYGDVVQLVGDKGSLDAATELLGNSVRALDETNYLSFFIGIAAGVLLGLVPLPLPGVPFPVRLGLAGGPLVAAIILSLIGSFGRIVWYVSHSANLALREFGIILFLACAGLRAGETFFDVALTLQGVTWMLLGFVVTVVPLAIAVSIAHFWFKLDYLTICGLVAGSMTDPPALAFADSQADSDASTTAYAAVYPLTMVLRIIGAQSIIYLLA